MTRVVHIRTDQFEADALHYTELPAVLIARLTQEQSGSRLITLCAELLRRAVLDPEKAAQVNSLSLDAFGDVVDAYLNARPKTFDWDELRPE